MPKRNRSKHYDFFTPNNGSNDSKKNEQTKSTLKKIWKWFKILLIVFVIGTGFVGCAQSFVLRSPVKVGTGFETYLKKENVSPNVEVFEYNKNQSAFKLANNGKIIQANPYLGSDSPEELEAIKAQIKANGGDFDQYKSQTLGIQLRDADGKQIDGSVFNKDNKYMVFAKGDEEGKGAISTYNPVTKWTNIYNIQKLDWDFKKGTQDGIEIKVRDKIKDVEISVLPDYLLSQDNLAKFNRDAYQALIYQSAELFRKNVGDNVVLANKAENTKTYWDFISEGSKAPRDGPALNVINSYIINLKSKKGTSLSDEEIQVISKIEAFIHSNTIEYGTLTGLNYVSNRTDADGYKIVTFSKVSNMGVYVGANNSQINKLLGEPHRPASTLHEYWTYGPFYGLFVWPINQMVGGIINGLKSIGGWAVIIALIVTVIVTRLLTVAISYKSIFASQKQQELNAKKAKIEAKYAPYKGDKAMEQKKRQEIQEMYKKNHANPYTAMISSLITLPILLVMFRVVQGSPEIKHSVWYGIQMSATSYQNLLAGEWRYLPIIIISVIVQLVAQLLPRFLNRKKDKLRTNVYEREALKKANRTQNIITIVFVGFGVIFQAGLQIYWIITGLWQIMQTLVVYKIERTDFYRQKIMPKL